MKCLIKRIKTSGFLFHGAALMALAVLVMAACDTGTSSSSDTTPPGNGGSGGTNTPAAQTLSYTGTKGGTVWKLVFTEVLGTARYTAKPGDKYELSSTAGGVTRTSRGAIAKITAASTTTTYTLTPANRGAASFDVIIRGGMTIASISGAICYTDGQYGPAPGIISGSTSSGGGGGSSSSGEDPVPSAVAAPTADPAGGEQAADQDITLATTTAGAAIYYTLNGTPPTRASVLYDPANKPKTGAFTLNVIAVKDGMKNSAVLTEVYTIAPQVAAPTADPAGGEQAAGQDITLATTTEGAAIYYTLDGTPPTGANVLYDPANKPKTGAFTLNAIAVKDGMEDSAVLTEVYTIAPRADTPTAVPPAGAEAENAEIALSAEPGATIYYTLDGSDPATSLTREIFSAANMPTLTRTRRTVKAIALMTGKTASEVLEASYTVDLEKTYSITTYPDYNPAGLSIMYIEQVNPELVSIQLGGGPVTSGFTVPDADKAREIQELFLGPGGDPASGFIDGAKYTWILLPGIIRKGEIGRGFKQVNPSLNMYRSVDTTTISNFLSGDNSPTTEVYKETGNPANNTPYDADDLFGFLIWNDAPRQRHIRLTQRYVPVGGDPATDETTRIISINRYGVTIH